MHFHSYCFVDVIDLVKYIVFVVNYLLSFKKKNIVHNNRQCTSYKLDKLVYVTVAVLFVDLYTNEQIRNTLV